jgi:signal peptidase I
VEPTQPNQHFENDASWAKRMVIGRNPRVTMIRIVVLVITSFIVFHYCFRPIRVSGISMLPSYKDRGFNLVNRLAYRSHEPQRGDVVAIRAGAGESIMYMKRIIGLPGESVAFHEGRAYINGDLLNESYLKFPCNWEHEPKLDGPDEYYCVGDNRSMPQADHWEGRIKRERIVGKVVL